MEKVDFSILQDGYRITLCGELAQDCAKQLMERLETGSIYVIDFEQVTATNLKALRILLQGKEQGKTFQIINVSDDIMKLMTQAGFAYFIDASCKPSPVDMEKYTCFGGSFLSTTYNSADGTTILKHYGPNVKREIVAREQFVARAVMCFGIPTPMVGNLYADGESTCLEFERITGKRSFSRIISEEPDRMEEIVERFANMCKKLHATPCDTTCFNSKKLYLKQAIKQANNITEDEKNKALAFLDNIPDEKTCLHGDMQLSNVIRTVEGEDLWIDLADFSYGAPILDIAMWYFLSVLNTEERVYDLFHLHLPQMHKAWEIFARVYFGADTPEKQTEIHRYMLPYAALHMLYLGVNYHFEPGMMEFIHEKLLNK